MRRILLIGSNGQVGQELQQTLASLGDVISVGRETLDLAQQTSIRQAIREASPDVIVNAAAYTAVDKAETETELAHAINAVAPQIMAEEAQQIGAALFHISTDYVFDGRKNTPYMEDDTTNTLSAYGKSKLLGEDGIRKTSVSTEAPKELRYIILRTAWVYGTHGKSNFVKTMVRLFAERDEVRVVADQVGTPTWANDIAQAIALLVPQLDPEEAQPSPLTGIYHFTNSGVASWYDFAIAIFEEAKLLGFPMKVQRIVPITTPEYPTPAQRPAYSVLSGKKVSAALGTYPPYWRDALRQMLRDYYSYTNQHS
ncbi:MAG TPA: dTDP-4-dehydrorhamnose reductase [Coleofasciculaceae cyanobacterium]|jgi:dTDP-4-dehydrorhamnose reductase